MLRVFFLHFCRLLYECRAYCTDNQTDRSRSGDVIDIVSGV